MTLDRRGAARFAAACWCFCTLACAEANNEAPLVTQRDSAGVQIVEAFRPAWDDASRWTIDSEPLLDLTRSGTGEDHEFYNISAVRRLSDGRTRAPAGYAGGPDSCGDSTFTAPGSTASANRRASRS